MSLIITAIYSRCIRGIRVVGAVVTVAATVLPIGIVDGICAVWAPIPAIGVADRIWIIGIGAQIAQIFSGLPVSEVRWVSLSRGGDEYCNKDRDDEFHDVPPL